MKSKVIVVLAICVLIVALALIVAIANDTKNETNDFNNVFGNMSTESSTVEVDTSAFDFESSSYSESDFNYNSETVIKLSDGNTTVDGSNVKVDNDTIYITAAGCYRISGTLTNGRIIVNAPKENVKLILDNASITCQYSSPIYVYKSSNTLIYLEDGSVNSLSDGTAYTYNDEFSSEEDEEPNATLYSKSDLYIMGLGKLVIDANFSNALTSKDTLYIENTSINIESNKNGINGKDSLTIINSNIEIKSGKDGIRSTNDTDDTLGWIKIEDSNITIEAGEDGIQAEKYIVIDKESTLNIDSVDDAIHSNASLEINAGIINIKSDDDGIHADETVTINGGNITISKSYEGIEGADIVINGGNIDVTASDDGINVNGGNDNSGFGGKGERTAPTNMQDGTNMEGRKMRQSPDFSQNLDKGNMEIMPPDMNGGQNGSTHILIINGGKILVNAQGDGLDSNGAIEMNGGEVIVNGPEDRGNGALDYNSSFTLNGGSLIAIGSSGMAQGVTTSNTQGSIIVTLSANQKENTKIEIKNKDNEVVLETTSQKTFNSIVASNSKIIPDEEYSIYLNGELATTAKASSDTSKGGFGGPGGFGGQRGGRPDSNSNLGTSFKSSDSETFFEKKI